MRLVFEWDVRKERSNRRKHAIDFDEAKSVFEDNNLLTYGDDIHSSTEQRFISIGLSVNFRILLVVHTEGESGNDEILIRIISARKATRR
ncbi:MAG: BrnT family toxin [Acidobacteria bacterium]|nr:BrnT family toxin [Acidobacteriota bacterium]